MYNSTAIEKTTGDRIEADLLAVLELLITSAPIEQYEALVTQARDRGVGDVALQVLETAKRLGLSLHSQIVQRQQREAHLHALIDLTLALSAPRDLDALLMIIARRARLLLGMDMCAVGLLNPDDRGHTTIRVADGQVTPYSVGQRVPVRAGLTALALGHKAPVWSADYLTDEKFVHDSTMDGIARAERLRAMLTVPLTSGPRQLGALYVADRSIRHFSPDECALMSSLGAIAGAAVDRTLAEQRRVARLQAVDHLLSLQRNQERLIELVLSGGTMDALAAAASRMLGAAVAIHSAGGTMLARAGDAPAVDAPRVVEATAAGKPVPVAGGWAAPVTAGASYLGFVLVGSDRPAQALLGLVAQTAALLVLQRNQDGTGRGWIRDELLDELLEPSVSPRVADKAGRLGVQLDRRHVVVVARPGDGKVPGQAALWASSYASRRGGLRSVRDRSEIVLLLPETDGGEAARTVSRELSGLLDRPVTAGASAPVSGSHGVYPAYREAVRCAEAIVALGGAGHAASPRELGFLGVLLSGEHDVDGFIDAVIGPVLDYDRRRPATALVRTLQAYFEAGGSPTYAAEALHIHPNTVTRRLDRIRELLGPDWQSPERALDIQLALRLCRIRDSFRQEA